MRQTEISGAAQEHIRAFAKAFLRPERQKRFIEMLGSLKMRRRFRGRTDHMVGSELKQSCSRGEPPSDLHKLCSARQVYLICGDPDEDDQFTTFVDAMAILEVSSYGGIVSIIPGRLALWKAESPSEPIWLY